MELLNVSVNGNVSLACPNPTAVLHVPTEMIRVFPEYQQQDADTKRNVLNKLREWITSEEARLKTAEEKQASAQQPQ